MIGFLVVLASITAASSVLRCWIAWRDYEKRWNYVNQPTRPTRRTHQ